MSDDNRPLIIACGALVSELREVLNINGLQDAVEVRYLPANLHNRPEGIVPALREHLDGRGKRPTMVGYADCGTGGTLDRMLESYPDVQRIPGAHCYEFFAGSAAFAQMAEAELGTFYLTDFLLRHFERLIMHGLGIDKHPQLLPVYFGNYTTLMYLCQKESPEGMALGQAAAKRLGLAFAYRVTGYGEMETELKTVSEKVIQWQN